MRRRAGSIALLVWLAGCRCGETAGAVDGAVDTGAPVATAAPFPSVSAPPFEPEPAWSGAEEAGDPLGYARLAGEVGAPRLLAGVRAGPPHRAAALAALPWADDAHLVLGDLVELARATGDDTAMLEAVYRVALQPPRQSEPLDPDSVARAVAGLRALLAEASEMRARRVLALSTLRALARAGLLDEGTVVAPVDL